TIYPEYNWNTWNFAIVEKGVWRTIENQRSFFDSLATQFQIAKQGQWYQKLNEDVNNNGGMGLLVNYYRGSLQKAMETVYHEYNWITWDFATVQKGFWDSLLNQRFYFDHYLTNQLQVTRKEHWYGKHTQLLRINGGAGLLANYNDSLQRALD